MGSKRLRRSATLGGGVPRGLVPGVDAMDLAMLQSLDATFLRDLQVRISVKSNSKTDLSATHTSWPWLKARGTGTAVDQRMQIQASESLTRCRPNWEPFSSPALTKALCASLTRTLGDDVNLYRPSVTLLLAGKE